MSIRVRPLSGPQSHLEALGSDDISIDPDSKSWWGLRMNNYAASHPKSCSRLSRVWSWIRGPSPPIELPPPKPWLDLDFTMGGRRIFLPLESQLVRFTRPLRHPVLFCLLAIGYIIGLAFLSHANSFSDGDIQFIDCTDTHWRANRQCGLNGKSCLTSDVFSTSDFRCPAGCQHAVLQNPRTVGNEQVAFTPLIVGGGDANKTYRADSFICAAAQHSGIVSNTKGGCGRIEFLRDHVDFEPARQHSLSSISFPTVFPLAYRFVEIPGQSCSDLRYDALALNIVVTVALFLFLRPKPIALYWSLICIGFWHISLFSDIAGSTPDIERQFGLFLPLLYISYVFWRQAIRYTLPVMMNMPIEACILYGGPFWVGVLNNLTFDRIPISRFTAADIKAQPGGLVAFIILIGVVLVIVVNQVRIMRKTGWLLFYLKWYAAGGLVLLILALLPTLNLRLHHYILAMLFMPGTAFPTRSSAIYQGLLLGFFLQGVARWDYDSVVQTSASLRRDATIASSLESAVDELLVSRPVFVTNSTTFNTTRALVNQTLRWRPLPSNQTTWDQFSLLIDDVERYVGAASNFSLASLNASLPHFFRLAYMSSSTVGDYTKAATLWPNGTWVNPADGASY